MVETKNLVYAMNIAYAMNLAYAMGGHLPRESRANVFPNSPSAPLMGSVHCLQDQKL